MIERNRARRVAGNHREARMEALDEATEQRRYPARDLGLAALAVRESGAVGGVNDRRGRQQLQRRLENGQPADAGIEEEDGAVRLQNVLRSGWS